MPSDPVRAAAFPIGQTVTLDTLSHDPYPVLRQLREREPVSWVPEVDMWFVTRRDDVMTVLGDFETFTVDSPQSIIRDIFGAHMMTTDGEKQLRYKRLCIPPFRPKTVEEDLRPQVEATVASLLERLSEMEVTELRSGLAGPLAIRTVVQVLGLPLEQETRIRRWYDAFAEALANFRRDPSIRRRGLDATDAFGRLVRQTIADASARTESTLLGTLAGSHDELTDDEIVANALIITFGGIETTESMIANAIWALLGHETQAAQVRLDPALVPAAIEESLRWEPAVQSCTRHVTRDTMLRGVPIHAGETVQCMLGAANRDPRHFSEPDRFDLDRDNAGDHLSFGLGRHFCLGAALARLEARVAIEGLLTRWPSVRLDPARPTAPRGYEFRKPPALWVRR